MTEKPEPKAEVRCRTCRFYEISSEDLRFGSCHVQPPAPLLLPDGKLGRMFTMTQGATDWCRLHERKA